MRRRAGLRSVLLATIALLAGTISQATELDPREFMSVDEIRPGMRGYGLTVFSGTRIDTFRVEILGVRNGASWTDRDLIWGRLAGGPLGETGAIAGMSGSPVYIDGRMIGAVGFQFPFTKEPLAGITPIAEMFDSVDREGPVGSHDGAGGGGYESVFGSDGGGLQPASIDGFVDGVLGRVRRTSGSRFGQSEMAPTPLAIPLMVGGVDNRTFNYLSPTLERMGFLPMEAGAGSSSQAVSPSLEPGAGVGVQFIRGDLNLASVGTLTYRRGDEILAFGHPIRIMGNTELPMTTVDVHFVVPTIIQSFKYASTIEIVGSITQDRVSAIAGVVGKMPQLMPLTITVTEGRKRREFEFEMIREKGMTPMLAWISVLRTIGSVGKIAGDYAISAKASIEVVRAGESRRSIEVDSFASGNSAAAMAGIPLAQTLAVLMDNPFEEVDIGRTTVEISLEEERRTATLQSLRVDADRVRPGQTVEATLSLRPYLNEEETIRVALHVPEDVPNGMLEIRVADAPTAYAIERRQTPARFNPNSVDELFDLLEGAPRSNELLVDLFVRRTGATVGTVELPSLPNSVLGIVQTARQSGETYLIQGTTVARERLELNYQVRGRRSLPLSIDRSVR